MIHLLCSWDPRCQIWKVEVDELTNQLSYLNSQQKEDLKRVLQEHTKLFDGTLDVNPHRKFQIDFVQGAVAKHARPYPVHVIHLEAFK